MHRTLRSLTEFAIITKQPYSSLSTIYPQHNRQKYSEISQRKYHHGPRHSRLYTYLQNKRMRRCGVAPPPIIFERLKLPQQIMYRRKENLSESPNHQKYWENILVSRFYEQFSRNRRNLGHFRKFEKISNSQNMNILYIILKHVIWRFQIYDLFREIFKFREDKSNNVFREIRKCFRKTPKFEFFAKQIIYLESPGHPLQNDI